MVQTYNYRIEACRPSNTRIIETHIVPRIYGQYSGAVYVIDLSDKSDNTVNTNVENIKQLRLQLRDSLIFGNKIDLCMDLVSRYELELDFNIY